MTLPPFIESALTLSPGRKLIVAHDNSGLFFAILDFGKDENRRIGGVDGNPYAALKKLEAALLEDAAKEMMERGEV